jgi:fused signal recognition particle receptor
MSLNWLKKKDESASPGIFKRLKKGLSKTRQILSTDIDQLFAGSKKIDEAMLEELEALLITSDIGVRITMELIDHISIKSNQISDADELKKELKSEIKTFLMANPPHAKNIEGLRIIMVVGVNGVGKTTTIGKIAAKYTARGEKVLIVAADTFRAAATEQMMIWAERAGAEIVVQKAKTDPAAVVYDGVETAVSKKVDIVLIDTAGRLHTKINLMEELKKIKRTISKKLTDAPHEILLVLDATTGQNALSQAKLFNDALGITGIALTKLDGTAKGGIVVGICRTLQIPLRYIGIGEKIDDLQDFDPALFTEALF